MWKKILISILALVGTFSIAYAYYNVEMSAEDKATSKQPVTLMTGRIGDAKQGDRYYVGVDYLDTAIDVQMVKQQSNSTWFAMNSKSFGSSTYGASYLLSESDLYTHVATLNGLISGKNKSKELFELHSGDAVTASRTEDVSIDYKKVMDEGRMQYFFIPTENEIGLTSCLNITGAGADPYGLSFTPYYFAYNEKYFNSWIWHSSASFGSGTAANAINVDGTFVNIWGKTDYFPMRFSALVNMEKQVFAIEKGVNDQTLVQIIKPEYTAGSAMYSASGNTMKTRVKSTTNPLTINFTKLTETFSDNEITKIENTDQIRIHYNTATTGNNKVSLLIKENNEFKYYYVLGNVSSNGQGYFDFDASQLSNGAYEFFLVNEEYSNDLAPVYASEITQGKPIEIVDSHTIAYTKTPQSNATEGDYEYSKNVNAGQAIGKLTIDTGGNTPLAYEVIGDGDDTYKNFELEGLGTSGTSSSTSLNVKIRANAPDLLGSSLKAGNYKFCITSVDANGYPDIHTDKTKVCTSLTVEKTTPTISFDQDDQAKTYVKGDVSNTVTHEEHATHTNGDTDSDVGITYSYVSGASIIQSGLPFTSQAIGNKAELIFKANMSGEVKIQAKIPESDNYKEATTTKTIVVQLGLTANYIEDKANIKAGSTEAKPPSSYSQASRIAHINVSGGTTPYSYNLPTGKGNNGSFHIDSSGNIYVNTGVGSGGLTPGTYDIEVEVNDQTSPTSQKVTVKKTITIGAAELTGVGWEDPKKVGSPLSSNTLTVTYDPSNNGGSFHTKLLETTTGSLSGTTIAYTLDPVNNDIISVSDVGNEANVTIKQASDTSTKDKVKIIATIKGGIYGDIGVTTELFVNVEKYTQTIAFKDKTKVRLPVGSACVKISADITSDYSIPNGKLQYTSSNTSANAPFTINSNGEVCPTDQKENAGSATLKGTLAGNDNFSDAVTPELRTIEVYVPGDIIVSGSIQSGGTEHVTYTPGTLLKANETNQNLNGTAKKDAQVAAIEAEGNNSPIYEASIQKGDKNADSSLFTVTPTGYVILNEHITAGKINDHGTGNIYYIQVDVTDDNGYTKTVDIQIVIENADADFYFINPVTGQRLALDHVYDDGKTKIAYYTGVYSPKGTIEVKTNLGSTYSEDVVGDTEVIDQLNNGKFTILNASDPNAIYDGLGGNTYVKACMNEKPGYTKQCIYAQVEITQAEQKDFAFVNSPTWTIGKTPVTIQPMYNGKLTTEAVVLTSSDNTIAETLEPEQGSDQSFKTTGKVGTITLTATAPEDRNYKSKQTKTSLIISEKPPTTLTLYVPSMTYGDQGKKAQISNGYKQGVPAYFYVDDSSILKVDNGAVNTKDSPMITAIGSGQVTIKVCQTNDSFDPLVDDCNAIGGDYGELTITVKQKPITLIYENEELYVGEEFPEYKWKEVTPDSFAFQDTLAEFKIPNNTHIEASGTTITTTEKAGAYDIIGSYTKEELTEVMSNYAITITKGTLTIKQDPAEESWYHLENSEGTTVNAAQWHNKFIDVVLDPVTGTAGTYDQISNTIAFSNTDHARFTITEEGENVTDIYFRIDPAGIGDHKGAISKKLQTTIKIDMTNPKITGITGYTVNTDGLSDFLNQITLGKFFKPGVEISIDVEDPQPTGSSKQVSVSGIKDITYEVYELDDKGAMTNETPIKTETGTPDTKGNMTFKINEVGNYRVCAITTDHATNASTKKCSDLNVKKIDVDVDNDDKPDFNDSDGDGCPDLNIKWKDPNDDSKWIVINGDRDYDGIPDLNIDSDGDGKADLNVDTDGDGKPDLNLVILTKDQSQGTPSVWVPKKCVLKDEAKGIMEEYCTGTDVKPVINIDTTGNGIPNINIDTNGDFKPDFNIDTDNDGEADLNIGKVHEKWEPKKDDCVKDKFIYDTSTDGKPLINIDTNGDGYPDVNVDITGDGKADINIDIDGDFIPDIDIDTTGDGKPNINVDTNGDGNPDENIINITEWIPEKKVEGDIPYGTMDLEEVPEIKDNGIIISKPSGGFLPNHAIKVHDISETIDEVTKAELDKVKGDQEIKKVYEVEYLKDQITTQPDGTIIMKIPVVPELQHPKIMMEQEDGTFKEVSVKEENGYYVFETEHVGKVSVLGDPEIIEPDPDPEPNLEPKPDPKPSPEPEPGTEPEPTKKTPVQEPDPVTTTQEPVHKPSVQGTYVTNGMGGANTADMSNMMLYVGIACFSFGVLCFIIYKRRI